MWVVWCVGVEGGGGGAVRSVIVAMMILPFCEAILARLLFVSVRAQTSLNTTYKQQIAQATQWLTFLQNKSKEQTKYLTNTTKLAFVLSSMHWEDPVNLFLKDKSGSVDAKEFTAMIKELHVFDNESMVDVCRYLCLFSDTCVRCTPG